jgi:hypothetical protein
MRYLLAKLAVPLALSASTAACTDDFDPYNELLEFRVLAVRGEPPFLREGETTQLNASIYLPDPNTPVQYSWSWCPFKGAAETKFDCAVSQPELQSMVDATVGPGVVTIPPYELATTSSTTFTYSVPAALFAGLCQALASAELPEFVERPACNGTWDATIRLIATSASKEIVAIKDIQLAYTATASSNANPSIANIVWWHPEQLESSAETLVSGAPPTLNRDTIYKLRADVSQELAETYLAAPEVEGDPEGVQKREILIISWFTESGETKSQRTTFIDGEIPFETLQLNELRTPRKPDFPNSRMRLIFVIRDNRGGVNWTEREVLLAE